MRYNNEKRKIFSQAYQMTCLKKSFAIYMGRIKSKLIKRTGKNLLTEADKFSKDFDENKRVLGSLMPSKKIRNQVAGYITRKKKIIKNQ